MKNTTGKKRARSMGMSGVVRSVMERARRHNPTDRRVKRALRKAHGMLPPGQS